MDTDPDAPLVETAPIWTIILIISLGLLLIAFSIYFIRRFRKRSQTHINDKQGSADTLVVSRKPMEQILDLESQSTQSEKQVTKDEEEDNDYYYSEPLQEIKISLPLPPPTTSFFTDKMELEGDLYDIYMTKDKRRQSLYQPQGFTIDLDSFSNAAAHIQRKASTMKKTLYQSIRKPSSANAIKPAHHIFMESESSLKKEEEKQETTARDPLDKEIDSRRLMRQSDEKGTINELPLNEICIPEVAQAKHDHLVQQHRLSLNGSNKVQTFHEEHATFLDHFPVPKGDRNSMATWNGREPENKDSESKFFSTTRKNIKNKANIPWTLD
ncbi:unnamed protein product [Rhizopus stolonifer]